MTWRTRFRQRESLLESLWEIPVMGAILGAILGLIVSVADEHLGAPSLWQYSPSTASAVLTSIVGATAALTGFVVTVTVLVVQMATGTFSARIMRLWYRDRMLKATLARSRWHPDVLVLGAPTDRGRLRPRPRRDPVRVLGRRCACWSSSSSSMRCIRRLRPVAVAADVARVARSTFAQTRASRRTNGHPMGIRIDASRIQHSLWEPAAAAQSRPSIPTVSSRGLAPMAPRSSCRIRSATSCTPVKRWCLSTAASSATVPRRSSKE